MPGKDDPLKIARDEAQELLDSLTAKQVEVLDLAAKGYRVTEIVAELGKSKRTIEDHFVAARKKLGLRDQSGSSANREATTRYIVLKTICGEQTRAFRRVEMSEQDIEKLFRALSFQSAIKYLGTPEFQSFMQAYNSTGPEALDAKFGRWWRPAFGLMIVVAIFVVLGTADDVSETLDSIFSPPPS